MRAHIRTEAYLAALAQQGKLSYTILREGLYNESWPLYLGYFYGLRGETRTEVVVGGDGPVSWTAIADMGFATAKVVTGAEAEWRGRTVYLSQRETRTLEEVARVVGKELGRELRLKVVSRKEHEDFYVGEMGMERSAVEWWSSTYEALKDGECKIEDGTLEGILREAGRKPKAFEETVKEMLSS